MVKLDCHTLTLFKRSTYLCLCSPQQKNQSNSGRRTRPRPNWNNKNRMRKISNNNNHHPHHQALSLLLLVCSLHHLACSLLLPVCSPQYNSLSNPSNISSRFNSLSNSNFWLLLQINNNRCPHSNLSNSLIKMVNRCSIRMVNQS